MPARMAGMGLNAAAMANQLLSRTIPIFAKMLNLNNFGRFAPVTAANPLSFRSKIDIPKPKTHFFISLS